METMRNKVSDTPYEKCATAMKILQFINAGFLTFVGIIHLLMFKNLKSFNGFVLTIYLFVFAALYIVLELGKFQTRLWFYFMNFGWGKGMFNLFLGLLLVSAGKTVSWIDILAGIWLILVSIAFIIISMVHKQAELDFVKDLIQADGPAEANEAPAENRA